ncbi:lipoprotein insertase outer membrane protein LolB [Luteimonas sp. BDR2-5]|uniref:lipoprotein insertase outer membrane protein LolB n=1 Tax=Proluteimonas luteida TaxID=2878685 RepID=UPI001E3D69FF|nr:lipoprotein insertase outer membrane protein LolB [Luteimonas sp. BDR2-5]MCD9028959.1 lipoprotein insertase outer membrane protein LolB [Luteimonas sp. BDR2-5]
MNRCRDRAATRWRLCGAAAALALLAACTSVPVRPPGQVAALDPAALAAAESALAAHEAAVRALPSLAFAGRVAMSNGRDGGSGRIEWRQAGAGYRVTLSAPVTRQSWQLQGGPHGARLEGLAGGAREGADVGELLWQATGFEIPVGALAAWAAGTRAEGPDAGPAEVHFDAAGRLVRLEQDGWTIDYLQWQPADAAVAGPALPTRINAARGDARVRLVVDSWLPGDAEAGADAGPPETP